MQPHVLVWTSVALCRPDAQPLRMPLPSQRPFGRAAGSHPDSVALAAPDGSPLAHVSKHSGDITFRSNGSCFITNRSSRH